MKNKISILPFTLILSLQIIYAQSSNENVQYKKYAPCSFSVSLPVQFKLIKENPDDIAFDYCKYIVKTKLGLDLIKISSLHTSIAFSNTISTFQDSYKEAISKSDLNIVYKVLKEDWFVISGTKKNNGNIVYWKRVDGGNFVSDLYIEYSKSQKSEIEPFLSKISTSFTSQ